MSDIASSLQASVNDANAPIGVSVDAAQLWRLQRLCDELSAERDRLHAELGLAQTERDGYLKSLYSIVGNDYVCPYTDDELLASLGREPPLRDFIAGLKRGAGATA